MISAMATTNAPHANSALSITGAIDARAPVARGPGPTSQAPIAIRTPTDRATQPAAASASVMMSQASLAAGLTVSLWTRLSTKYFPAAQRLRMTSTPTTTSPIPSERTSWRRRPRASQMAPTQQATARIQTKFATCSSQCVTVCAVFRSSDLRMVT